MSQEQAGNTGYSEYRQRYDGKKEEYQEKWEIARWEIFMLMSMHPYIKASKKPKTPQSFYRFPWEKDIPEMPKEGWEVSDENARMLNELVARYIAKHG